MRGVLTLMHLKICEIESSPAFKEALLASFNDQSQEHVLNFRRHQLLILKCRS